LVKRTAVTAPQLGEALTKEMAGRLLVRAAPEVDPVELRLRVDAKLGFEGRDRVGDAAKRRSVMLV
jgi:hypothetical protein